MSPDRPVGNPSTLILVGDARAALATLGEHSVHCVVTSPPYWGLREYDGETHGEGFIGLEETLDEHLDALVAVFREVRRVLRPDGTLWLNYGDSYCGSGSTGSTSGYLQGKKRSEAKRATPRVAGLKPKDLMMLPFRVADALQRDGWWIRKDIIWHKPNPMPEPVKDRPTVSHEFVWLMSPSGKYFYDQDAVRTDSPGWHGNNFNVRAPERHARENRIVPEEQQPLGANLRDVWTIPSSRFPGAHFATFPPKLVEPCVQAGTSDHGCCGSCGAQWKRQTEKTYRKHRPSGSKTPRSELGNKYAPETNRGSFGTNLRKDVQTVGWEPDCGCDDAPLLSRPVVLDPFGGAGTVGLVANRLGRDAVLVELSRKYADMSKDRIEAESPLFADVRVTQPDTRMYTRFGGNAEERSDDDDNCRRVD